MRKGRRRKVGGIGAGEEKDLTVNDEEEGKEQKEEPKYENEKNMMRHLLKEKPTPVGLRSLRARSHNFILPPKENKNFISRALYHAVCPPTE